jgi:hypothetical protein
LKLAEPQFDWFFQRPFHVDINGRRVLNNFDICHAARGPRHAYESVFRCLVPDAAGRLVLRFTSGWDPRQTSHDAIVQAIEVLPEEKSVVLKFAELWLPEAKQRPMDIQINGQRVWEAWDAALAAGQQAMAADVRVDHIAPDATGHIVIHVSACGDEEALSSSAGIGGYLHIPRQAAGFGEGMCSTGRPPPVLLR